MKKKTKELLQVRELVVDQYTESLLKKVIFGIRRMYRRMAGDGK